MNSRLVTTGLQEIVITAIDAFECITFSRGRDGGKCLEDIAESAFGNLISNEDLCAIVKGEELLMSSRGGFLKEIGEGNYCAPAIIADGGAAAEE